MMTTISILNLTMHAPTGDQKAQGVVDAPESVKAIIAELLLFNDFEDVETVQDRVNLLASTAKSLKFDYVLVGGALWLQPALYKALLRENIIPLLAFTKRVSTETRDEQNNVIKINKFSHEGFVAMVDKSTGDQKIIQEKLNALTKENSSVKICYY